MRLFVALDPGAGLQQAMEREIERLRPLSPDAKWVRPDGIHLTLAFLGNVPDEKAGPIGEAVAAVAARNRGFHLEARNGGGFGSRHRPRVLWIGLEGETEPLALLRTDLELSLVPHGYQPEERPFRPHLTLARARDQRGDFNLADCAEALLGVELGGWDVGELILYRSDLSPKGARYTALVRAPLAR